MTTPQQRRRRRNIALYLKRRDVFLTDNPRCFVGDDHAAGEIQHLEGRLGALLLDESKWRPVCRPHHVQITENPTWALANGYALPRIGRSA